MANLNLHLFVFLIVIAITACLKTEARLLKEDDQFTTSVITGKGLQIHARKLGNPPPSTRFDHQLFNGPDDAGIRHLKEDNMQDVDDFKGPGHSPGIGHSAGPKP